jgi:hypothetical protein
MHLTHLPKSVLLRSRLAVEPTSTTKTVAKVSGRRPLDLPKKALAVSSEAQIYNNPDAINRMKVTLSLLLAKPAIGSRVVLTVCAGGIYFS